MDHSRSFEQGRFPSKLSEIHPGPERPNKKMTPYAPIIAFTLAAVGWIFVAFEKRTNAHLRRKLKESQQALSLIALKTTNPNCEHCSPHRHQDTKEGADKQQHPDETDHIRFQLENIQKELEAEQALLLNAQDDHLRSLKEELQLLSKGIEEDLLSGTSTPSLQTPPRDLAAATTISSSSTLSHTRNLSTLSSSSFSSTTSSSQYMISTPPPAINIARGSDSTNTIFQANSPQSSSSPHSLMISSTPPLNSRAHRSELPAPHRLMSLTPSTSGAATPLTPNSPLAPAFSGSLVASSSYTQFDALDNDSDDDSDSDVICCSDTTDIHLNTFSPITTTTPITNSKKNPGDKRSPLSAIPALALAPATLEAALSMSFEGEHDGGSSPRLGDWENEEEWLLKTSRGHYHHDDRDDTMNTRGKMEKKEEASEKMVVRPLPRVPKLNIPLSSSTINKINTSHATTGSPFVSARETIKNTSSVGGLPSARSLQQSNWDSSTALVSARQSTSRSKMSTTRPASTPSSTPPKKNSAAITKSSGSSSGGGKSMVSSGSMQGTHRGAATSSIENSPTLALNGNSMKNSSVKNNNDGKIDAPTPRLVRSLDSNLRNVENATARSLSKIPKPAV